MSDIEKTIQRVKGAHRKKHFQHDFKVVAVGAIMPIISDRERLKAEYEGLKLTMQKAVDDSKIHKSLNDKYEAELSKAQGAKAELIEALGQIVLLSSVPPTPTAQQSAHLRICKIAKEAYTKHSTDTGGRE